MKRHLPPEEVVAALRAGRRFLVVSHVDPDPDAVGSVLALDWALRRMGKVSTPVTPDPPLAGLDFIPGLERLRTPDDADPGPVDTLVILDCDRKRAGKAARLAGEDARTINIDHHATNPGSGDVNWILPDASATGFMVYHLLHALDLPIDVEPAICLYAGLAGDTGSFAFSNTDADTLEVAADLARKGVVPGEVARHLFSERPRSYLQLVGRVLGTLRQSSDGRIAWAKLTQQMLRETGAGHQESDGLVQYPLSVAGVEVAILLRETERGEIRLSLRSKGDVDVSKIAAGLGGGGHQRAAGCIVGSDMEVAQDAVLRQAEAAIAALEPVPEPGTR